MKKISFSKLSAAGNDFILIDKSENSGFFINSQDVIYLCNRHYGVGADGVLIINDSIDCDFEMEYFNSDGSTGMLCGNGARSIIRYAKYSGRIKKDQTTFKFHNQYFSGKIISDNSIAFNLKPPTELIENISISVLGKTFKGSFINTGAHHVVIDLLEQNLNDLKSIKIDEFPVVKYGRAIRNYHKFLPLGTNVNFVLNDLNSINIRTYERGVEEETLACGTGAVASAIIFYINKNIDIPVKVRTRSGEILKVSFNSVGKNFENVTLVGPANIVYKGEIFIQNRGNL
jgi:diaminopimelate epimerase